MTWLLDPQSHSPDNSCKDRDCEVKTWLYRLSSLLLDGGHSRPEILAAGKRCAALSRETKFH